jgi:hypothetical protein
MWRRRTLVGLGLALLHLVLAATVVLECADAAWAPSYVDGDDRDARPLPLSEPLPALAGEPDGVIPRPRARAGSSQPASVSTLHLSPGFLSPRGSRAARRSYRGGDPTVEEVRMFGLGAQELMLILLIARRRECLTPGCPRL